MILVSKQMNMLNASVLKPNIRAHSAFYEYNMARKMNRKNGSCKSKTWYPHIGRERKL